MIEVLKAGGSRSGRVTMEADKVLGTPLSRHGNAVAEINGHIGGA